MASQRGRRTGHPRRNGARRTSGGGGEDPPKKQHNREMSAPEGGVPPSMEEGEGLQGFTPARAQLSLQEVYGDFLNHNNGTQLAGGVLDDVTWKSCWRRLAA